MNRLEHTAARVGSVHVDQKPGSEYASEYDRAVARLDCVYEPLYTGETVDIVGVLADIKPGAIVLYTPELPEVLEGLGLRFSLFGMELGLPDRATISKNQSVAEELANLFIEEWEDESRCRRIGQLLGYPKSATDYYVKRRATLERESELPMIIPDAIVGTVRKEFCQFNLSPDYWREEIDEYVIPLENAVRELTPQTFATIRRRVAASEVARLAIGLREGGPHQSTLTTISHAP